MTIQELKEMAERGPAGVILQPQTVLHLIERYEKVCEALRFYAGLADDSEWDGCKFLAFDKFGGLCDELGGPYVAEDALSLYGPKVPLD